MTDPADATPNETPMQRALRLKKEAADARPKSGAPHRELTKRESAGAFSKPWMKK